jgi:hypothetical protein
LPDSPSSDAGSLSARAQEILRRADSQLAALRAPAPPPAPPLEPEPEPADEAAEPDPPRPAEVQDLGQLIDTVEAGIGAARAHLVALSATLERIAEEIHAATEEHRRTLPPGLADHARLPEELVPHAPEEPTEPEPEPAPEAPAEAHSSDAAHDAARLVAVEMAVAGDTREGVGRRLREEFGIRDPGSILDDAFGPESGSTTRRSTYGS